jgi:hypothetical protein
MKICRACTSYARQRLEECVMLLARLGDLSEFLSPLLTRSQDLVIMKVRTQIVFSTQRYYH